MGELTASQMGKLGGKARAEKRTRAELSAYGRKGGLARQAKLRREQKQGKRKGTKA